MNKGELFLIPATISDNTAEAVINSPKGTEPNRKGMAIPKISRVNISICIV